MKSLLRNVTLLLVLFFFCLPVMTKAQMITTVAGTGTPGSGGDGAAATAAQFALPTGICIDGSNNIYVADQLNHKIRKITASTGVITTIAGTGTAGFSGDGTAATGAQLNNPHSVCVDASGNIYIADVFNHRIRKITASTGLISTIAGTGTMGFTGDGGLATSAQLSQPVGVALDATGNVYISLQGSNNIRKITVATGNISTVAGTGTAGSGGDGALATAAQLNSPHGIALDAAGNIYISDQNNHKIRKVTAATGIISTIAGTGSAGFSGDGSAATSAQLKEPVGVAVDAAGNIFIADYHNTRVRKIAAATSNISTAAGTGGASFGGDGGLAVAAQVSNPIGVCVDASGNLFIADSYNRRIRKVLNAPPAPVATTTITYCQNATSTALTATGTALLWYTVSTGGTGSSTAPVPSTATAGSTTYYVSQTIGGLESPRTAIVVNVTPLPAAPVVTSPVIYCSGTTASALTATGTSLKWYTVATGGTGSTTAPTPSTSAAGSTTYYVSQTVTACEGPRASITVTVNATPAAPTVSSPVNYCIGATASALSATGISGATIKWYTVAAGGSGSTTAPTPGTSATGTTTWYVSQTSVDGCEGPRAAISVVINSFPSAPTVTSPVTYCKDVTASALTATGSNLKWYTAPTGGTGSTTAPTPSTATVGITNYYVSQTSGVGCESSRSTITVAINDLPAAPGVTSSMKLCVGGPSSALTAAGTSLKWYTVATGGTGSTTAPTPPTTMLGPVTYYVSQTSSLGCEGPRSSITVTVYPLPLVNIMPSGSPDYAFCPGAGVTLKAKGNALISYQWQLSSSNITGATDSMYEAFVAGPYGVVVTDTNNCTSSTVVNVFKDTLPVPQLSPLSLSFCIGKSFMLFCSPATLGYTYEWSKNGTVITGAGLTNSKLSVNEGGIYTVKVTDIFGCTTVTNASTLTTYPAITKPSIIRVDPVLRVNNIYHSYQWYRNYKAIPGANAITYVFAFDGIYYAEVSDLNSCKSYTDTININSVSINETSTQKDLIKLYPNPAQEQVNIESPLPVNISVRDITGRELFYKENARHIDMSSFADGLYIFMISDKTGTLVKQEKINKVSSR